MSRATTTGAGRLAQNGAMQGGVFGLVAGPAFKAGERRDPSLAGSIPVRLRGVPPVRLRGVPPACLRGVTPVRGCRVRP